MLYFVSTPIGNLKDISLRALEVLKSVDYIACEDKRHSLPLLNAYDIKKPLLSYQKFNEKKVAEEIIGLLNEGKNVAVISDAGTPVLSDPGAVLCKELKAAGLGYTVVPGANALLPAIILSAFDSANFCFIGFLPPKKGQIRELLSSYENLPCPLVFYCAPHDLIETVKILYEFFVDRKACAVQVITMILE
ncbi:MAG: 16S rRNA (cytidine(1402)-2'-O)-methyltransferase, partial [Clostridia bacterium]|nr:16S rRNA (cytidine(1402)-2'-O)-methyltransferase [Clostridia bacterium]